MPVSESAASLMLTYIKNNHEALVKEAKDTRMGHEEFLDGILAKEAGYRRANRVQRKLREACFPYRKYL